MITEITNNPFRILGLPVNANRKEIDRRYHELIEGLNQQELLADALKEIENAYLAVTSSKSHWHHASFWFACLSDADEHAIQYVEEEDYESAIDIWESNENYVSIHNLMLCYILMGETSLKYNDFSKPFLLARYGKAFQYAQLHFLVDKNFASFVEYVDEGEKDASDEAKVFLDVVFSQTVADKPTLYALLGNQVWMEYVRGKWVDADEADVEVENMRDHISLKKICHEAEEVEKSRKSLFKWIWWVVLFPIYLYVHHRCKENPHHQPLVSPIELIKTDYGSAQRTHPVIDMTDSATFNRVNSEMKIMRDKSKGDHRSLREIK